MNAHLQTAIERQLSPQQINKFELEGARCSACEKRKVPGQAFCTRDMHKLPAKLQAELKFATGSAWHVLYQEAKDLLTKGRAA